MASKGTPYLQLRKYELHGDGHCRIEVLKEEFGRGAYAEVRKVKFAGEFKVAP